MERRSLNKYRKSFNEFWSENKREMCSVNHSLKKVPIIDITNSNFTQLWPSLIFSISTASFVALDVELSGLGRRRALMAKSVEDRYKAIGEVAKSRSIISIGLSCYRHERSEENFHKCTEETSEGAESNDCKKRQWVYHIQTFNITLLCMEEYVVEPDALRFLVQHEFDFNKQYSKGVPYVRGNDKEGETSSMAPSIRKLFLQLLQSKQSIIIHNGLVDLVFLYHNLYAELPTKLSVFLADIHDMFKGGIYDTKYIAEFKLRYTATYLEYVFRKTLRSNATKEVNNALCLRINFPTYDSCLSFVEYRNLSYVKRGQYCKSDICETFANHGWCPNGNGCIKCHDVNVILDIQEETASKKRKRNRKSFKEKPSSADSDIQSNKDILPDGNSTVNESSNTAPQNCGGDILKTPDESKVNGNEHATASSTHRASYDAFMTGFIMAVYLTTIKPTPVTSTKFLLSEFQGRDELANRIFLSAKDYPLVIQRSNFAKLSKEHLKKISKQLSNAEN